MGGWGGWGGGECVWGVCVCVWRQSGMIRRASHGWLAGRGARACASLPQHPTAAATMPARDPLLIVCVCVCALPPPLPTRRCRA